MSNYLYQSDGVPAYDMLIFCHLRWDFVYQRPQHIISRLAKQFRILVIEEPVGVYNDEQSYFKVREVAPNIHICQPLVENLSQLGAYLKKHLHKNTFPIGWFYSAAFVSVLSDLDFDSVIYDCMDELSLFKGASSELLAQEDQLLAAADIVYTGGRSLFESKSRRHHNVHCFPSSVDIHHFSNHYTENIERPADLDSVFLPIVGYYGVIDERIDLELLRGVALLRPDFAFVMIGPLCKIDESDLPNAENIHYLGMKTYEELPKYLHFFKIAMMPFALNDATRFISPTKTLEYMAANKPIISTRIRDVERSYSSCVNLVDNPEEFSAAIQKPFRNFKQHYRSILSETSWDRTVQSMSTLITDVPA
ncbi:glycosyltransferase [Kaistella palustris]|uniref:glycosyltransferase n=1 Tax=Kaistella palustris TaxID=493376 RepID=UPI000413D3C8|nr:glycosyltransferase [Kaistella palustris]